MIKYSQNPDNFYLQHIIFETFDVHNNKMHKVTQK